MNDIRNELVLENLETKFMLSGEGFVEIENVSRHDLCQEVDSVQHRFYAVERAGATFTRVNPIGRSVIIDSVHPGYDINGENRKSPNFDDCDDGGGSGGNDERVLKQENDDGTFIIEAIDMPSFPARPMRVVVNGVSEFADRVDIITKIDDGHFPTFGNVFANSSTRWKFPDALPGDENLTKFTGSAFFGPLKQVGDLPQAEIQVLRVDWGDTLPTIIIEYRQGGSATIELLEATPERTRVKLTANFSVNKNTPFLQYTGMIASTDDYHHSDRADVQMIATYDEIDGYKIDHVLEQGSDYIQEAFEFRNQRPRRDTNSGPDHIFRFSENDIDRILGHQSVEMEGSGAGITRGNASQEKTKSLGPKIDINFRPERTGYFLPSIVYSRDNILSATLHLDRSGSRIANFVTEDTGRGQGSGLGWDNFFTTNFSKENYLARANDNFYSVSATAPSGLTEVDVLSFVRVSLPHNLPSGFDIEGKNLIVNGGSGKDFIRQFLDDDLVRIRLNNTFIAISANLFDEVIINGKAGRDKVVVESFAAGDMAWLYPGNGRLERSEYTLRFNQVEVKDVRSNGVDSRAVLGGTRNNDRFFGSNQFSRFFSTAFASTVRGFNDVIALANSGGFDVARIQGTDDPEHVVASIHLSLIRGELYSIRARNFDRAVINAGDSKNNTARLLDSLGNDRFVSRTDLSFMRGTGYFFSVRGIQEMKVIGSDGHDRAVWIDSDRPDRLDAAGNTVKLRRFDDETTINGFDFVEAISRNGGKDVFSEGILNFILRKTGNWVRD